MNGVVSNDGDSCTGFSNESVIMLLRKANEANMSIWLECLHDILKSKTFSALTYLERVADDDSRVRGVFTLQFSHEFDCLHEKLTDRPRSIVIYRI